MALTGRCHCGRNAFHIDAGLPEKLTRCTCSLCSKRGHLYAYYPPEKFKATQADSDAVYRWNSKLVANHFCSACGCDLYADSPAFEPDGKWDGSTRRICVNARLLDDFEAADWPVTLIDGKHLWRRRPSRWRVGSRVGDSCLRKPMRVAARQRGF